MAVYKVPQDVEADDKLIGPFSLKQFIFLIVAAISGALSYILGTIVFPLFLIPLPVAIFFIVLALPLKKDQPMEVYLAALISFYLKPKRKIWVADGIDRLVEITYDNMQSLNVPTRDLTFEQAQERLAFLADVVDSKGWAVKDANSSINRDVLNEANSIADIHDSSAPINRAFNDMIQRSDLERKNKIITRMKEETLNKTPVISEAEIKESLSTPNIPIQTTVHPTQFEKPKSSAFDVYQVPDVPVEAPRIITRSDSVRPKPITHQTPRSTQPLPVQTQPQPQVQAEPTQPVLAPVPEPQLQPVPQPQPVQVTYNSVPSPNMNPLPSPAPVNPEAMNTITNQPSPDIISLATNHDDLSVETIAAQARRLNSNKEILGGEDEVVISLR